MTFRHRLISPTVLFVATFALYVYTLAPSVAWGDSVRIQMDVINGASTYALLDETSNIETDNLPFDRLGVAAWDHPLYVMIGHVWASVPLCNEPCRVNLFSALFGALTVVIVFEIGLLLVEDSWAASVGALALAVSHTFWLHSVTAEVYTLCTFILGMLLLVALRERRRPSVRLLAAGALISGLGAATHLLLLVGVTASMTSAWLSAVPRLGLNGGARHQYSSAPFSLVLLCMTTIFLLGFSPWLIQFARMSTAIGLEPTLKLALSGPSLINRVFDLSPLTLILNLGRYATWLTYQFLPLGLILGVLGFLRMFRDMRPVAVLLLLIFVSYAFFSANFRQPDRFTFHIFSYVVFALAITCGALELRNRLLSLQWPAAHSGQLLSIMLLIVVATPPLLYESAPGLLRKANVDEPSLGIRPTGTFERDALSYYLVPSKRGDTSASAFGDSTMKQLGPNSLVISPGNSEQEVFVLLRYFQTVEKRRSDVHLDLILRGDWEDRPGTVFDLVQQQAGCRPIYFTSKDARSFPIEEIAADFTLLPQANLYLLVPNPGWERALPCKPLQPQFSATELRELIHLFSGFR